MPKFHTIENLPENFENERHMDMAFEQYKLLIASINNLHLVRESANFYWMPINIAAVSGIAYVLQYIEDKQTVLGNQKTIFLGALIGIGILICTSWLLYLNNIQKSIKTRNKLLLNLEVYFPIPLFKTIFANQQETGKSTLTLSVMIIPFPFLCGYLFFAFLLLYFVPDITTQ